MFFPILSKISKISTLVRSPPRFAFQQASTCEKELNMLLEYRDAKSLHNAGQF